MKIFTLSDKLYTNKTKNEFNNLIRNSMSLIKKNKNNEFSLFPLKYINYNDSRIQYSSTMKNI